VIGIEASSPRNRQYNFNGRTGIGGADVQQTAERSDPALEHSRAVYVGRELDCIISEGESTPVVDDVHNQHLPPMTYL
jgi:hypothetical protein